MGVSWALLEQATNAVRLLSASQWVWRSWAAAVLYQGVGTGRVWFGSSGRPRSILCCEHGAMGGDLSMEKNKALPFDLSLLLSSSQVHSALSQPCHQAVFPGSGVSATG